MLAMVVSESSFGAYVCPGRCAGLYRDWRLLLNLLDILRHHFRARNWTFDENHVWSLLLKVPFKTDLLVKTV